MSRLDQDRVMDILAEVVELPAETRGAFLDSTCAGEPELRRELEELLACADPAAAVFDSASQKIVQPDPDRIGPYEILDPIGEGGMAIVYKAQQLHPVKRIVALKLIKLGMDTRQFVARFESERQALAMMNHPNVARVYDAGSTETGRPYFVMEYVPGEPILQWCDARKLPLRRRLELFIAVCEAVEHAHRKGIIHRDLKDSNVLITEVDGRALPKVIDFGVAKVLSERLTDRTVFTEQGQLIGTPEYMSPEQAERGALDIDTRSDIYSLGVLLYELIAGVQPISSDVWRSGSFEQVQRIIRETEPPRPSTRLSSLGADERTRVAQSRQVPLPTLIRALRSELEWIPLKAMRKDREQRYRSAAELADDIRNYLDGRPLLAGPESASYKFSKFVWRNRTAVVAGVMVVSALLIATGVSVAFGISESRQRRAAETARAELQQVAEFQEKQLSVIDPKTMGIRLRADILAKARRAAERSKLSTDAVEARIAELEGLIAGTDLTGMALETLDNNFFQPAIEGIQAQFADQPLVKARLLQALAATLRKLGLLDRAVGPQTEALDIRRRVLGGDHPDTLTSINELGDLLRSRGNLSEAESLCREGLERCRRVLGDDDPITLEAISDLGSLLVGQGKLAEAEPYHRESLEKRRRVLGEEHRKTIASINNMGYLLRAQGKLAEAEPFLREALEKYRRLLGNEDSNTLNCINNLAILLYEQRKLAEAEPYYRESLETSRRVLGEQHPDTIVSINNMAVLLHQQGRTAEAESYYREALKEMRRVLGSEHRDTLSAVSNLGGLLMGLGRLTESEQLLREAMAGMRRVLGDEHHLTLNAAMILSAVLLKQGRSVEVVSMLAPAEPAARRVFAGGNVVALARVLTLLGRARTGTGEFDAAHANLMEAHTIAGQTKGALRGDILLSLAELHAAWHAAAPGKGHDVQSAEYRAELQKLQAATQPSTAPR